MRSNQTACFLWIEMYTFKRLLKNKSPELENKIVPISSFSIWAVASPVRNSEITKWFFSGTYSIQLTFSLTLSTASTITHDHSNYLFFPWKTHLISLAVSQPGRMGVAKVLTDTNWELSGPVVVLLADPHWGANESESRVALVNHCVSVTKVFSDHLPIHDLLWNAAVTSCRMMQWKEKKCTVK